MIPHIGFIRFHVQQTLDAGVPGIIVCVIEHSLLNKGARPDPGVVKPRKFRDNHFAVGNPTSRNWKLVITRFVFGTIVGIVCAPRKADP